MSDQVLCVSELTKRFEAKVAVDRLSLSAKRGELVGLVGPDGAGKTTTLRILAGILPADDGTVLLAGLDVIQKPEAAKSMISYMPQQLSLYEDLTVAENMRFFADLFEVSQSVYRERERDLLEATGMNCFRHRLVGHLSGGMKRKLGVACALIHTPKVVLLDEPTAGVDPVSRREIWNILYSLAVSGVSVVVSTAYLEEAERCHRLLLMHKGRRLFFGSPADLKGVIPGGVLSVSSPDLERLRVVVASEAGILSSTAKGNALHIVVDDPERRLPQLCAKLQQADIPFDEIRQVSASVEDAFIYAISQSEPQERPQQ